MQTQEQEDLVARQQRKIQHLKGASAQSGSPPVVELDPLGPDSGGMTFHQAAPDRDDPFATAPAISPPLPPFPGEALPSSPPQVVQPVSSAWTTGSHPSNGHLPGTAGQRRRNISN